MVRLQDVLSSYCTETCALDCYVGVYASANFNDFKCDCFSLTIAVEPQNEMAGLFGELLQILNDNIHVLSRLFDYMYITGENLTVVVLSP
jgi:hypothetical protein